MRHAGVRFDPPPFSRQLQDLAFKELKLCAPTSTEATCTDIGGSGVTAHIDHLEPVLRPALVAELARCAREADCAAATQCWAALQPALGLAAYQQPK
jgi:hypothetical protein